MTAQVWVAGRLFAANAPPSTVPAAIRAASQFGVPSVTFTAPPG